jgi:GR25 family glycosyltransferase involved in LPS biosynthesis
MMEAFVITISNNPKSNAAAERCIKSANIPIKKFEAITEIKAEKLMRDLFIKWNYPWKGEEYDMKAGVKKTAYQTANPLRRVGCFLSHYLLWKRCAEQDEPIIVLEHDAIFIKPFDETAFMKAECDIISINDPRGATRKAQEYHDILQSKAQTIQRVPTIDDLMIPQGLPGNSAYIIKPSGAKKMLELVKEYGAWPNDALMCKQLIQTLASSKVYYTKVQGIPSTTTL